MNAKIFPLPGALNDMILEDTNNAKCNICGGVEFELGPNDRKSATGKLPRCKRCRSLERHRQLRQVYAQLPDSYLDGLDVLQLSPDIGVDPAWFNSYEISVFEGENPLDLEAIDRADASYDLVICNHVIEHVANDRKGLRELMRITRPGGFVQITVPAPYTREVTVDWGYPKEKPMVIIAVTARIFCSSSLKSNPAPWYCRSRPSTR